MALFGSKKKETKARAATPVEKRSTALASDASQVIHRPRLTEKAAHLSSQNVYTFDVAQGATKHDVSRAVTSLYTVKPLKVHIVNTKGKSVSLRTRRGTGTRNRTRKAYVYLKKGDTIDFAA